MIKLLLSIYRKIGYFFSINWYATLKVNYKMLPYSQAKLLPIIFFGRVKLGDLSGKIVFNCPVKRGLLLFGYKYEMITVSDKTEYLNIAGEIVVNGLFACGSCYKICVSKTGVLTFGNYSSLGRSGTIVCTKEITLGEYARIGFNSLVSDSNYHKIYNIDEQCYLPMMSSIIIGNYNYIGSNVAIQTKTRTPSNCIVAAYSLCNKDYTKYGENVLIGGYPVKLLRTGIVRDWGNEKAILEKTFTVHL